MVESDHGSSGVVIPSAASRLIFFSSVTSRWTIEVSHMSQDYAIATYQSISRNLFLRPVSDIWALKAQPKTVHEQLLHVVRVDDRLGIPELQL